MTILVSVLPPPGPAVAGVFSCSMCGDCCTDLRSRRGRPDWPESFARLAPAGYYGLPTEGGLQAWSWERAGMLREAASRGIALRFVASLAVADEITGRLVTLLYEMDHEPCVFLGPGPTAGSLVCGAYEARPLICRAFPVVQSEGIIVPSSKCPDIIEPERADREAFMHVFGSAFLAAEAANGLPREVALMLRFLEETGVLRLARNLSKEQILLRRDGMTAIDLWDLMRATRAVDIDAFWLRLNPHPQHVFTPTA